jgi:hypothetical protein
MYFGTLLEGQRLRYRKAAQYWANLTVRRIIYISAGMLLRDPADAGLQFVIVALFATFLPQINVYRLNVHLSLFRNRLECFNEWLCGTLIIFCSCMTDYVDVEMRLNIGWFIVIASTIGITVNAVFMLCAIFHTI